ncbi:MAG: DUF554 domain-containing protein [Chloroflexi bacterium]|jgi:hypothetical protein|nr:DUF554 domain-containing protein [Anaerolineaceae bacterium]NLI45353.1 DUF554 domain-containing protein [Chloroflexota bacterium]HOE34575.1 DUF554 domain-containing protein [Anaerolineaceae bacterium]HOT25011.1 DUF554 domain-containing protein [Anaerolineaceae bacterium]HQH57663.1 DUF554 domain-containing protein [Anaerolineaceae bacterium]
MIGTFINVAAILLGGLIGLTAGHKIPAKFRQTIVSGLGLFTLAYGIYIFTETKNMLIPLGALILGTIAGEWLKLEERLESLGSFLQAKFNSAENPQSADAQRFINGFVTTSLLFCIGPMAILGSIQDGLSGNFQMLAIKSLLDGLASVAFASSLGAGVLFSALPVLVYQGAISLSARALGQGFDASVVAEMTAIGGVILAGIAISNLLEIKKIRTGSFLPALVFAVLIVLGLNALGIAY